MMAEILENMISVLLALIMMVVAAWGYRFSYDVYKEYRADLCEGTKDYTTLFFSVMLFIASTYGVLVCLLIIVDSMGW